jgi:hypothetical protein
LRTLRHRWRGSAVQLVGLSAAALLAACSAVRHREVANRGPCGTKPEEHCRAECGHHESGPNGGRERRCEDTVHDLCRAECLQGCGDDSPSLATRIQTDEWHLEHDCGSGRPSRTNEIPPDGPPKIPNPVDRLLL